RYESVYAMGFLDSLWGAGFFLLLLLFLPHAPALLPAWKTFGIRIVFEIFQAYVAVQAVAKAERSSFGFIRTGTIPLLLLVDLWLGYAIGSWQILGMAIICGALLFLFMNHGINPKGLGYTLAATFNAVITISLFKYNISHGNSLILEQFLIYTILLIFFYFTSRKLAKEHPFTLLKRPLLSLQSATQGIGGILHSFAYQFAPASIIIAATRSSGILWTIISGRAYFHEKKLILKTIAFVACVAGIVLLVLPK
ncbi:MAG: hypothetical protein Q8R07_05180, partial [Candidatus Uhrbacteria bacterium]|nr:hypothetical protein [Candidatus Uhrbacteria bacterium]